MKGLIDIILDDMTTELDHAEARNDHRAVDILRMVIQRIEAREYEHSAMQEAKEDDWITRINKAMDDYEAMNRSRSE